MRNKIYQMVHVYERNIVSIIYKYFMMIFIVISLFPLTTKNDIAIFEYMEGACLIVFLMVRIIEPIRLVHTNTQKTIVIQTNTCIFPRIVLE